MMNDDYKDPDEEEAVASVGDDSVVREDGLDDEKESVATSPSSDGGSDLAAKESSDADVGVGDKKKPRRCWIWFVVLFIAVIVGVVVACAFVLQDDEDYEFYPPYSLGTDDFFDGEWRPPSRDQLPPVTVDPKLLETLPLGPVDLPSFSMDGFEDGYQDEQTFRDDVVKAAKHMVNAIMLSQLRTWEWSTVSGGVRSDGSSSSMTTRSGGATVLTPSTTTTTSSSSDAVKGKIQHKTNNREEDADEPDLIKSDDNYVYASFGDYVVVWERFTGDEVSRIPINQGNPFVYVQSIILTENHVMLVVNTDMFGYSNYGVDSDWNLQEQVVNDVNPVFESSSMTSELRLYTKPDPDSSEGLALITKQEVFGYFLDARVMDDTNSIHLVSGIDVNLVDYFYKALEVQHFTLNDDPHEYVEKAALYAETELIPNFVDAITKELKSRHGTAYWESMFQINAWSNPNHKTESQLKEHLDDDMWYFKADNFASLRSVIQIQSIAIDQLPTTATDATADITIPSTYTAILGPASWAQVYASEDSIVLLTTKENWDPEGVAEIPKTILMHLKIAPVVDGDGRVETQFFSTGITEGTVLDTYSVDIQDGVELRIATTVNHFDAWNQVWEVCGVDPACRYDDDTYDKCLTNDNWNECFNLAMDGCQNVVMEGGCPYTRIECDDEEPQSSTSNFVIVYDVSQKGDMMERGRVKIGEPHERIQSVRFTKDFSYAVTFDLRDPFYVLSLPIGEAPSVEGSVKLDGFSSYLHPMNEDNTFVVGIGRNVTGEGIDQTELGLMVSVFDVTDKSNPTVVATSTFKDPHNPAQINEVSSEAQWEPKAVTYHEGKLVIPLASYSFSDCQDNFNGFTVLDVGSSVISGDIKELFRVNHSTEDEGTETGCYHYCSDHSYHYFASPRSFVYEDDGSLMTIGKSVVVSTNIETGEQQWFKDYNKSPMADGECCDRRLRRN